MAPRIGTFVGLLVVSCCLMAATAPGQSKRSKSDANIAAIGHRNIAQGLNFYSPEREKELGNELAQQVAASARFINDPAITSYVEGVERNVERNSDKHPPITIHLIDTGKSETFTLPGGHEYLSRGLLLRLENEGELASVLARGIAQTALRVGTRMATTADILQTASVPVVSPADGSPSAGSPPGVGPSPRLAELKARRDAEFDADYFAVQYLYKSGYDTKCFLDLVTLTGDASANVPQPFSAYPPLTQRLQALQEEIAQILPNRDGAIVSTNDFQEFRTRLQALKPESGAPQKTDNNN